MARVGHARLKTNWATDLGRLARYPREPRDRSYREFGERPHPLPRVRMHVPDLDAQIAAFQDARRAAQEAHRITESDTAARREAARLARYRWNEKEKGGW